MTDKRGTKILAQTFFNQLRTSGYNPNQIIAISTELLDLVTTELRKQGEAAAASQAEVTSAEQRQVA